MDKETPLSTRKGSAKSDKQPNLKQPKGRGATGPPKKARWSSADDNTLVQILIAQQAAGNQADGGWKAVVYPV